MSSPSHATFPFPADEAASAGPLNPLDSASLPEPVIPVVDARDPTEHARKLQRSDHGQDKSSPSHVGAGRTTPSQEGVTALPTALLLRRDPMWLAYAGK